MIGALQEGGIHVSIGGDERGGIKFEHLRRFEELYCIREIELRIMETSDDNMLQPT